MSLEQAVRPNFDAKPLLSKPVLGIASLCRELLAIDAKAGKVAFLKKSALLKAAIENFPRHLYGSSDDISKEENLVCNTLGDALNTPLARLDHSNTFAKAAALSENWEKVVHHKNQMASALAKIEFVFGCLADTGALPIIPDLSYGFVLQLPASQVKRAAQPSKGA